MRRVADEGLLKLYNEGLSDAEIAKRVEGADRHRVRRWRIANNLPAHSRARPLTGNEHVRPDITPSSGNVFADLELPDPAAELAASVQAAQAKRSDKFFKSKYETAIQRIASLEGQLAAFEAGAAIETYDIEPSKSAGVSEATIVAIASDWHIEEEVDPLTVNGKNKYTLKIAKQRGDEFFQGALRLAQIMSRDVTISEFVLALLGDFITGHLHEENVETAQLEPMDAMLEVRRWLASGIQFLLDNSDYRFTIPCHSGNHARTTEKNRNATESGHSLEYVMYHMLADHFAGNPRVNFIIPKSYHSYLKVYDTKLRFSHGHAIKYGGGVGGPTISINKAIANWNTVEWADIDCFGHLHQRLDGENFVMNGSLIGYNAYAMRIKAKFQKPAQTLFLVDKKRGKTAVWPIVFTV
jgi:hypothetical protein